ncbi:uncharacterized protein LOC120015087 [Tripterygium wilfordii]|uniref:uncharacterized protein LOC120015087 n=1 Tax=Tripterygium wilfordii TaxID=458696 RepID=UPI0018F7EDB4|nr:uncharacterized protein LOC120015087 [Tripterygium wilfordii]
MIQPSVYDSIPFQSNPTFSWITMSSPTKDKDSSIDQQQGQGHDHEDEDDVINNPIIGIGSSISSPDPTHANETTQTPTNTTEIQPSQTPPLSPTPPLITSSAGVSDISQINTHLLPSLTPPAATSVAGSSRRKRGRPSKESSSGGDGESSSSMPHKLLSGDHSSSGTEQPPIKCVVCGREFSSNKAYFGHLRKHPDRQWRGAYPPPVPAQVKKLGPTLLELANQTVARMSGTSGPTSYYSSSSRGSLDINLNNPPPPPRRDDDGALPFDLNMPPPLENEEQVEDPDDQPNNSTSDIL